MVLTNASAQTALQTLRTTTDDLQTAQERVSTGLKVSSAVDNPAFFLVTATQRADRAVIDGTRENLDYALGAVRTALAAQTQIDEAILNIKTAVVALENGTAEEELQSLIEGQIELVRDALNAASFNGVNLLAERETETFIIGVEREQSSYGFQTLDLVGQGLALRTDPVDTTAPPYPGAVLDLNSSTMLGAPGLLNPTTFNTINGLNTGTNITGGVDARTFAISFETGADITTEQIIYEEGGNVRGLNISLRNGNLVFGGYNLVASDPTAPWAYQEVQATVEANTRYTAQLVLDGNASNTGEFRAYLDGVFVDAATGVGILYDHPGAVGVGRINGDAVVNGTVKSRVAGPGGNDFQGLVDKVVAYNEVYTGAEFDQINSYLAEDWLPDQGIQYYIGVDSRKESATLVELLEAIVPLDQDGFSVAGALEVLDAAQAKANTAFAQIGFYESRLTRQSDYLFDLSDSVEQGIAALVEADLGEESARLQALEIQTELATQGLLLTNGRTASLLQLFN